MGVEREAMEYDVVIVGAGPSGLSAAIRLKQLRRKAAGTEITVAVLEKGSEVGAHILSGAVIDPKAHLRALPRTGKRCGAPLETPVTDDRWHAAGAAWDRRCSFRCPSPCRRMVHNHGNYVASLGNVCSLAGPAGRGAGRRDLSRHGRQPKRSSGTKSRRG